MTLIEKLKHSNIIFNHNNETLLLKVSFDDIFVNVEYLNVSLKLLEYDVRIIDNTSDEGKNALSKLNLTNTNNVILICANVKGPRKGFFLCGGRYNYNELLVIIQDNGQIKMQQHLLYKSGNVNKDAFKFNMSSPKLFITNK